MNIIELEVILHHTYNPTPIARNGPAQQAEQRLLNDGLIERDPHVASPGVFRLTERGRVFINALKNVPLPVQAWVNPIPTKEN